MDLAKNHLSIEKLATGIPGFDMLAHGGLPKGRTTLISGSTGSGKTIFAAQFLVGGITQDREPGIFVTFEESPDDIRRNLMGFGWDTRKWEDAGLIAFVDASPEPRSEGVIVGEFDLAPLLARMEDAVKRTAAQRVAIDSLSAIFGRFPDKAVVRNELHRIILSLREMGVTTVLTAERRHDSAGVTRFGVEEFVADNVIILRNEMEVDRRRRTLEILKFRGTDHYKGEYPFTIRSGQGLVAIPLVAMTLQQGSSDIRISSGNSDVDGMCGGGFYRDSIVLVSGATGTGKTLMTTEFVAGGAENGERSLLFAFEESRQQLLRNARGWGIDFAQMERDGLLKVLCVYPEVAGLEDHLIWMKDEIEAFKPQRIAVDSLSALERVASIRGFREFAIGLTSFVKHREVAGLFTATTPTLMGGTSVTEGNISTITDSIILLRYVEVYGEIRRGITILKMRGSWHDTNIREFNINDQGLHVGKPFRAVTGILTGYPVEITAAEINRIGNIERPKSG